MNCMKCGVTIPDQQVFCDHCLSVMDQHPVKPDIRVHLPKRAAASDVEMKLARIKRTLTPDEQISELRIRIMRLRLTVVILIFVALILAGLLGLSLYHQYSQRDLGRNYIIDTTMTN